MLVRAWTPTRQPVYHPSDEDLSLGTPAWRPALLIYFVGFAAEC